MNLDNLTHTSGEWLRGTGPESDIVISSRIRLARNLAAFPFTNRASSSPEGRDRGPAARPHRQARTRAPARATSTCPACPPSTGSSWSNASSSAGSWPPPRARAASPWARSETVSLMVNEEDHLRLQVMRSGFALDEAWQDIDQRRRPARAARQLRLQRGVRLPDRLPDQRRHRHARQRDAAPAGAGADQADREGLPRPAEDQPGRARPLRRRQPGLGRLLPDLQPGDARQERDARSSARSATSSRRSSATSGRPAARCCARTGKRLQDRVSPGLRHALLGHDDDLGRDDGPALQRPPGHQPAACSTTSPSRP